MATDEPFDTFVLNEACTGPAVLILHGCCQGRMVGTNNDELDITRYGSKLWKKLAKKGFRLVFARAPNVFIDPKTGNPSGRHWFSEQLNVPDIATGIAFSHSLTSTAFGMLAKTMEMHKATIVIGFSQGANVLDAFMAHDTSTHPIVCAVLMSGYELTSPERKMVDVPTLSLGCTEDTVVPWDVRPRSYTNLTERTHPGTKNNKHVVPTPAKFLDGVVEWICANI